ncbi:MAG: TIM barrel protein [Candidatus Micrarchaeota archaeon]|nr:TIM barrel protein [Candidatus Micrarchaeota archaeon]
MTEEKQVRFGPAGIPAQCKGTGTLDGVKCCAELGLTAMEMEFVRGVRMKEPQATAIGIEAKKLDISLSSHAPYYINLCSTDEVKAANSRRHIYEAAKATFHAGGRITVFHSGYYQDFTKEEAYKIAKKNLLETEEKLKQENIKCVLGAETVGKKSQFGGLLEVIKLAQEIETVQPVIDFSHLVARADFPLKTEADFKKLFDLLEKELGDYVKHFHGHFQEVNYSDKGELNHLKLGTKDEPPYKPFMKMLADNGYSGTIISESPIIEEDAIKMKQEYEKQLKNKK